MNYRKSNCQSKPRYTNWYITANSNPILIMNMWEYTIVWYYQLIKFLLPLSETKIEKEKKHATFCINKSIFHNIAFFKHLKV